MSHPPFPDKFQEVLEEALESSGEARQSKMQELMGLVQKARDAKQAGEETPDENCPEDVDDCSDVVSSCCGAVVDTIFGTLPLQVKCRECGELYMLGELMRDLIKNEKKLS